MSTNMLNELIVIGGGAAGMLAAGTAAEQGARVVLLEPNDRLGKKLYITGKGRCNVTNDCPPEDFFKNVPRNPRFLYSSIYAFPPSSMMELLERLGCPLKTERGARVFPQSDRSASVIDALRAYLRAGGVQVKRCRAEEILTENGAVTGVKTDAGDIAARAVILAAGGCSYPLTGSTGDGYRMAQALGHTIVPPTGSLVPLVEKGHDCAQMQGLSLRNIAVRLENGRKKSVFTDFGELLFTHFGVSGPVVLSASAHMKDGEAYTLHIDLKPALDDQTLDARLLREFSENPNRDFDNVLGVLLPRLMIPVVIRRSGIAPDQKVNAVTREQRRQLLHVLKDFTVEIACKAPVEEAIVTSGGVKVSEVEPGTMRSKLVTGLYFAGEILDVDAYTGGFNLLIAWSTARAAALAAAEALREDTL